MHANQNLVKIFIPGCKFQDLSSLVQLIYNGRVEILPQQVSGFQRIAQALKIPLPKIAATFPVPSPESYKVLITPFESFKVPQEAAGTIKPDEESVEIKIMKELEEKDVAAAEPLKDENEPNTETDNMEESFVENGVQGESVEKQEEIEGSIGIEAQDVGLKRSKRKRKEIFKVSESNFSVFTPLFEFVLISCFFLVITKNNLLSPSSTRASYIRKSTGKKLKSTEPDSNQFRCQFCSKIYKKSSIRHVAECIENPERVIAHCSVCHVEVKPSGMSAHKKWHHG